MPNLRPASYGQTAYTLREQMIADCAPYHDYLCRLDLLFRRPFMVVRAGQVIESGCTYPPAVEKCMAQLRTWIEQIRAEYEPRIADMHRQEIERRQREESL